MNMEFWTRQNLLILSKDSIIISYKDLIPQNQVKNLCRRALGAKQAANQHIRI
jgi:hypothetical protein